MVAFGFGQHVREHLRMISCSFSWRVPAICRQNVRGHSLNKLFSFIRDALYYASMFPADIKRSSSLCQWNNFIKYLLAVIISSQPWKPKFSTPAKWTSYFIFYLETLHPVLKWDFEDILMYPMTQGQIANVNYETTIPSLFLQLWWRGKSRAEKWVSRTLQILISRLGEDCRKIRTWKKGKRKTKATKNKKKIRAEDKGRRGGRETGRSRRKGGREKQKKEEGKKEEGRDRGREKRREGEKKGGRWEEREMCQGNSPRSGRGVFPNWRQYTQRYAEFCPPNSASTSSCAPHIWGDTKREERICWNNYTQWSFFRDTHWKSWTVR